MVQGIGSIDISIESIALADRIVLLMVAVIMGREMMVLARS